MWIPLALACLFGPLTPSHTRPDPGVPTEVTFGLYLNDVILIEEPAHSFMADLAFRLDWRDPRLAHDGKAEKEMELNDVWHPEVVLLNERRTISRLPERVRVEPDGTVRYLQRLTGSFTTRFDLRDFPLDRQVLRLHFSVVGASPDEVRLVPDEALVGQREELSLTEWGVGNGQGTATTFRPLPGTELSAYEYELPIERRRGYYIWKILVPLALIVGMGGCVFWIDTGSVGPRLSIAVSSMLTLIAYRFLLGNLMPKLSYLTRMDHFILGTTVMVFGALVATVAASRCVAAGKPGCGQAIDRWGRLAYPLVLVGLLVVVF